MHGSSPQLSSLFRDISTNDSLWPGCLLLLHWRVEADITVIYCQDEINEKQCGYDRMKLLTANQLSVLSLSPSTNRHGRTEKGMRYPIICISAPVMKLFEKLFLLGKLMCNIGYLCCTWSLQVTLQSILGTIRCLGLSCHLSFVVRRLELSQ